VTDLQKLTKELGAAYAQWKDGEKEKDKLRKEFWGAIDELAVAEPEEKLIEIDPDDLPDGNGEDGDPVAEYVEREHPAWNLDEYRTREDDWVEAILILKPELKAFSFVNAADGMVYQRQFVSGSPVLDDEALQEASTELWIDITQIPNYDAIAELVYHTGVDAEDLEEWINDRWTGPRTLQPLDSLDAETLALVEPFIHPGKPSVKLPAPRKAKPEELETVAEDAE